MPKHWIAYALIPINLTVSQVFAITLQLTVYNVKINTAKKDVCISGIASPFARRLYFLSDILAAKQASLPPFIL